MVSRLTCFFLFLLSLLLATNNEAQQKMDSPVWIDRVEVAGNKHTKTYIILREIPFTFPDSLTSADIMLIKNRIQNLFLFNRVELQIFEVEGEKVLFVLLTESWYLFPLPQVFINEHDWDKISYGMQITHYNFRGRNEKVRVGGWLGYNPSYYFNYYNPWIGDNLRLILGFGAARQKVANRIFDFREDHLGFSLSTGRRLSLNLITEFLFALDRVRLPREFWQYTVTRDGEDLVPSLKWQVKWDRRDLYEYPGRGFYFLYILRRTGFTSRQPDFWRFELDNRLYFPVYRSSSFGIRQLLIFNHGDMPIYDRVFLGFENRIRGHFSKVLPDPMLYRQYNTNHISLTSMEFRFPILPVRYFTIEDGPIIPTLFRDLKFGISAGIFMDTGIAWKENREFGMNRFYTGYGVGIHFHLPYIYILRFDFALNDQGDGEIIIDAGISF